MQSNPLASLSVKQLKRAIAIRGRIETLQKTLNRLIGQPTAAVAAKSPGRRKKRRMSAAARARISAAAKARWAKFRKNKAA